VHPFEKWLPTKAHCDEHFRHYRAAAHSRGSDGSWGRHAGREAVLVALQLDGGEVIAKHKGAVRNAHPRIGALCFGDVGIDPLEDFGEPELSSGDGTHNELVGGKGIHFQVISIDEEKGVCGCEGHALVAIEEGVIVGQGFHKCSGFFCSARVVAQLGTEDGRLQKPYVSDSLDAAILVDLLLMDGQNFGDGEVSAPRHLLRQLPIEFPKLFVGAAVRFHHFRPHHVLGRDDGVDIVLDRLLKQISLGLPVFFRNRHKILVEFGVDRRTDLDCPFVAGHVLFDLK